MRSSLERTVFSWIGGLAVRRALIFATAAALAGCDCGDPGGSVEPDAGPDASSTVDGDVPEGNLAPMFVNEPPASVREGETYLHGALAEDPNGELIDYELVAGPEGMEMFASTGALFWPVGQRAAGSYEITLEARDPWGASVQQSATITVERVNVPPRITSLPPPPPHAPLSYAATASDDDGDTLSWSIDGGFAVDGTGRVTFSPTPGVHRATLTVSDGEASDTQTIAAGGPLGEGLGPLVRIDAPAPGAVIEGVTPVTGAATDPNLATWILEACQPDTSRCRELARDVRDATGELGELDPSPFLDEPAILRLRAWDADGNLGEATRMISIESGRHAGFLGLEMTDFVTRRGRDRIEIGRNYLSPRTENGELGVGWELASNIERGEAGMPAIRVGGAMSTGWRLEGGIFSPYITPTSDHSIQIDLPDGRTYLFEFAPEVNSLTTGGAFLDSVYLSPPGVTLEPITLTGGSYGSLPLIAVLSGGEDATITDFDTNPYEPPAYRMTTSDGVRLEVTADGRVLSATGIDPGTSDGLRLDDDGVFDGSRALVRFHRNAAGRIERIEDLVFSRQFLYGYEGDRLTSVTYPDAMMATFEYEGGVLSDYTLPDGIGVTRVDYDERGRMIRRVFPEGRVLVYEYDEEAGTMTMRDAAGQVLVHEYDDRGNVVRVTDALGHTTTTEYDAEGREIRQVDAEGREQTFAYDASGQLVSRSSPGRGSWSATWGDGGPTEFTDVHGRSFTTEVDPTTGDERVRGPSGQVVRAWSYDAEGRVETETSGPNTPVRYRYDDEGRVERVEQGGTFLDIAHSPDGLTVESMDESGERVMHVENPAGDVTEVTGDGGSVEYDYDFGGNLRNITAPFGEMAYEHDPGGNLTEVREDGEVVAEMQYDPAGRIVLERRNDGSWKRTRYDAAGRIASESTPEGTRSFAYDDAGELLEEQFGDGRAVALERDPQGRVTALRDNAGRNFEYEYDARGRVIAERSGSAEMTVAYDDASGLPARIETACGTQEITWDERFIDPDLEQIPMRSYRDLGGVRFDYVNDTGGHPTRVDHPDGTHTELTYEPESDQVSRIVDANTNVWNFDWEGEHLAETTTPEGLRTTFTENPDGEPMVVRSDASSVVQRANGDVLERHYDGGLVLGIEEDEGGRTLRTIAPDAETTYVYGPAGELQEIRQSDGAVARFEPDALGRIAAIEVAAPDGSTARTSYEYDSQDRIAAIVDPGGGRTEYEYGGEGARPTVTRRPNGTVTRATYSASGRPTELTHTDASGATLWSETYVYGDGCRLTERRNGSRRHAYRYDVFGRLASVQTFEGATPVDETSWTYDALGNRIRTETSAGVTTHTYDRDGRIVRSEGAAGTTTYTYDGRGNLIGETGPSGTRTLTYDAADRLVRIEGAAGSRDLGYDAEGQLVRDGDRRCLVAAQHVGAHSGCLAYYGGGEPLQAVVQGPAGVAGDWTAAGGMRFSHGGLLDSTVLLTATDGATLGTASYDAWGVEQESTLPDDYTHRFNGELQLDGLVYLRARWYVPEVGAFSSPDAAPATPRDPRSLHRYLYALGDPTNRVDPEGTFSLIGVQVSISIQNNQQATNNAAQMRARCTAIRGIRRIVTQQIVNMALGVVLQALETAIMGGIAFGENPFERIVDKLLRQNVFCSGPAASWLQTLGWDVKFQVDIDRCGSGGVSRLRNPTTGASNNRPVRTGHATCNNPTPPLLPGAPWTSLTSGVDFLIGSYTQNGRIRGGIPIELKRSDTSWSPGQHTRYCRYAARSQQKLLLYVYSYELPSQAVYARRVISCAFCWRGLTPGACRRYRTSWGALLLYIGVERQATRRKIRVYYPNVPSLC
jgi:RHS repeat-associated protein